MPFRVVLVATRAAPPGAAGSRVRGFAAMHAKDLDLANNSGPI
jgi:hypothetical protein